MYNACSLLQIQYLRPTSARYNYTGTRAIFMNVFTYTHTHTHTWHHRVCRDTFPLFITNNNNNNNNKPSRINFSFNRTCPPVVYLTSRFYYILYMRRLWTSSLWGGGITQSKPLSPPVLMYFILYIILYYYFIYIYFFILLYIYHTTQIWQKNQGNYTFFII